MRVALGLVGTGTVGCGCLDILMKHQNDFLHHYGIELDLVSVCSKHSKQALAYGLEGRFTEDFHEVIHNPSLDIVIELVGGITVAREVVMGALYAGKHVVTANKALMATYGEEIFALAKEKGCEVAFEASVGGGIPIIAPLRHTLLSNEISSVVGIVNGTTNYMLTRMVEDGLSYGEALAQAQEKGFAEADPSADVDGLDAAAKIAILASIAFNARVSLDDVYVDGIRNITPLDLDAASDMGYCVKLLALAHRTPEGIDVRVHPTMLPLTHPLASVGGVYNAIYVTGDAVGETMFFGEGAGGSAAASSVMGDVLDVARRVARDIIAPAGCVITDDVALVPIENLKTKYYIRFKVTDRPGVLAAMAGVFAHHDVSVFSVVQRGRKNGGSVDLVYVTHTASEKSVREVLEEISHLEDVLRNEPSVIRVED